MHPVVVNVQHLAVFAVQIAAGGEVACVPARGDNLCVCMCVFTSRSLSSLAAPWRLV